MKKASSPPEADAEPEDGKSGAGGEPCCLETKPLVKEGEEVIPQTMLHLKGDQMGSCGAPIVAYSWTVKQPAGSNQVFVPASHFPNPTFTTNSAGEYEFCLSGVDAKGNKSCTSTCIKILVLPEEAIHVELLWDTPADSDQTDTGPSAGADLDLHFAHKLAVGPDLDGDGHDDPWFSNPFDTFWFNPSPNWGGPGPPYNNNPTMDLDDTNGAGPENLNLDDPEGTVDKPMHYSVGVHYWNAHGFGTSYATVNIYIMGVLAVQYAKVPLSQFNMWYVGRVNWPNSMTGGSMNPFSACYMKPDCALNAGGKCFWQPNGDPCITKCYVNPAFVASQSGAPAKGCN